MPPMPIRYTHPDGCDSCHKRLDPNDMYPLHGVVYCEECRAQIQRALMITHNHNERRIELGKKHKLVQIRRVVEVLPWSE